MREPGRAVARQRGGEEEPGPPSRVGEGEEQEERRQPGAGEVQRPGPGAAVLAQVMGEELLERAERRLARRRTGRRKTIHHVDLPGRGHGGKLRWMVTPAPPSRLRPPTRAVRPLACGP